MSQVSTLVDNHTREALEQLATAAGVPDPESMANKEEIAQAIVDAGGNDQSPEITKAPSSALPAGWQLVQEGPDYFSAETTIESLGLQKVSEGAATLELLIAACEGYDAHQAAVAEGRAAEGMAPAPVEEEVA